MKKNSEDEMLAELAKTLVATDKEYAESKLKEELWKEIKKVLDTLED